MNSMNRKEMKENYKTRSMVGAIVAIRNKKNGKMFIQATQDMEGSRNRFAFARTTGSGLPIKVQNIWQQEGPDNFEWVVLEELKKGEGQSEDSFAEDMRILKEMWMEKISPDDLY